MKKLILIAVVSSLVFGCLKKPTFDRNITFSDKEITTQSYSLAPFNSIIIHGNITTELANGNYAIDITGLQKDTAKYKITVKNKDLIVDAQATAYSKIKIFVPKLINLIATDNISIVAKKFKTTELTINAQKNATINLEGQLTIKKIKQSGDGRININWVNSDQILIESSAGGPIYLAGIANEITAKLTQKSILDARFLRTKNVVVFTTDQAHADILAINELKASAFGQSTIYYYKRPQKITVVTKDYGNVTQPEWIR